jgi:hypothetical protein
METALLFKQNAHNDVKKFCGQREGERILIKGKHPKKGEKLD